MSMYFLGIFQGFTETGNYLYFLGISYGYMKTSQGFSDISSMLIYPWETLLYPRDIPRIYADILVPLFPGDILGIYRGA
jgi:hypothetical protein